jgi:uncharacterized protein (TIGR02118 family)
MAAVTLAVLYPWPTDVSEFEKAYDGHLKLMRVMMQIPPDQKPYRLMRFNESPLGVPPYYLMFTMPFPSQAALLQVMSTQEMQEVAVDAVRISTGGPPTILVGSEG